MGGKHSVADLNAKRREVIKLLSSVLDSSFIEKINANEIEQETSDLPSVEGLCLALSAPLIGDENLSIPHDIALRWPQSNSYWIKNETNAVISSSLEAERLWNADPALFIQELANFTSITIGSPSLCYTIYLEMLQREQKTVIYDMRSKEAQIADPVVGACSVWDYINYNNDEGLTYTGEFRTNNYSLMQQRMRLDPMRVMLILPNSNLESDVLAPSVQAGLLDRLLSSYEAMIESGTQFASRLGHVDDIYTIIDPKSLFYVTMFLRVCCAINQFPEMIVLCRATWYFNKKVFQYNRYAVPPDLFAQDNISLKLHVPVEIIPPAMPLLDFRSVYKASLFVGLMPPCDNESIYTFAQYLSHMSINVVYLIGDYPPPVEIQEDILDTLDYWERYTVHECITKRTKIMEQLKVMLRGGNRILLMDVATELVFSTGVAANFLHDHFHLDLRSAAMYLRIRMPHANMKVIKMYIMSDRKRKNRTFADSTVSLYQDYNWDEESSFRMATISELAKDHADGGRNIVVRKFGVD